MRLRRGMPQNVKFKTAKVSEIAPRDCVTHFCGFTPPCGASYFAALHFAV
jgi:hypothetical protein